MKPASKFFAFLAFALIASAASSASAEEQAGFPRQHQIQAREIRATHMMNKPCPMPSEMEVFSESVASPVLFASGSDKLTPETKAAVKKVAALLKTPAYQGQHILISGYTDSKGKDASNQRLSYHRALTVMHQLIKDGVPASQVTAQGFGKENPVATNATAAGRALNRRVTFTIGHMVESRMIEKDKR
jgi:outer membrane protein OmpA-like peptidoglycan-associated protein